MKRVQDSDPDGLRLPIKLDATSNGEFVPVPLDAAGRYANRLAQEATATAARRSGQSRRKFLISSRFTKNVRTPTLPPTGPKTVGNASIWVTATFEVRSSLSP